MQYSFISLMMLFFSVSMLSAQSDDYIIEVRQRLRNAADYTLAIAEMMPEAKYDFRPVEDEMRFSEQLLHIISNVNWLTNSYLDGIKMDADLKDSSYTKAEILLLLQQGFEYADQALSQLQPQQLGETVRFFAGPMTKRQILTLLNDHHAHHRGQLIVYLRLNHIKPPRYVGW